MSPVVSHDPHDPSVDGLTGEGMTPPGGGRMAVAPPGALPPEVPTPPGTEMPPELRKLVGRERDAPETDPEPHEPPD